MLMKSKMNKKSFFTKVFTICFCVISFALVVSMADIFSSLITVGGFSFVNENISANEYSVYAICTSNHPTKLLAEEFAEDIKKQGGAGCVYMNEQSYYIIASIYETESDAQKVKNNLIESKPNVSIQKLVIPKITISSNLTTQEKNTVMNCISIFKTSYQKLYDISVSLDTNVETEVGARLLVNELNSELGTIYNNFNTLFSDNLSTDLLRIKLAIEELKNHLQTLIDASGTVTYSAYVKECYCKIIMSYKSLAESFN